MKKIIKDDVRHQEKHKAFDRLLTIMDQLRETCPWDKKQTWESLRHLTIEEVYELSDSILEGNREETKKELGDVILHIVFYARIASEEGCFDIADVLHSLCDKLIERHPHIYGNTIAKNEQEVKKNWENIKLQKGNTSVLQNVPRSLPSMVKAIRIQDKAKNVGFDWQDKEGVWQKVEEELEELKQERNILSNKPRIQSELGDLLFSLINYARFIHIDPDEALEQANKKFIKRFQYMEKELTKAGKKIEDAKRSEMNAYWNKAKSLK